MQEIIFGRRHLCTMETSRKEYNIVDGVSEADIFATDEVGMNLRLHVLKINKDAKVMFKASSNSYYQEGSTAASRKEYAADWGSAKWGYSRLDEQIRMYEKSLDTEGIVIAGTNADFYYYEGKANGNTYGELIIEGNEVRSSKKQPFFVVMNDGTYKICNADDDIKGILETASGEWMLREEKIIESERPNIREPRQAIGITKEGDVIIVNVEGRNSISTGIRTDDLAIIMSRLGCVDAINLDGGGSASLMTMRQDDGKLDYRNEPSDGYFRNVSSSLLVVKTDDVHGGLSEQDTANVAGRSENNSGFLKKGSERIASLKKKGTELSKTSSGVLIYKINGKAQEGLFMINGNAYCFDKKGCGVSGERRIGKSIYYFKNGEYTGCSDENAGDIRLGYLDAEDKARKIIYVYHCGDKLLNIDTTANVLGSAHKGASFKMKNWDVGSHVPLYSIRFNISEVFVGEGVASLGNHFLHVERKAIFEGSIVPGSCLKKITLPDSLKVIGKFALFNNPKLDEIVIPAGIETIKGGAFSYTGARTIEFKGDAPCKMEKKTFFNTYCEKIIVKKTNEWKEFADNGGFESVGYFGTVEYR